MTINTVRAVAPAESLITAALAEGSDGPTITALSALRDRSSFLVIGLDRQAKLDDGIGIDASIAAAAVLSEIGLPLLIAAWPGADHPYNFARRVLTLDHLSEGQAGIVFPGPEAVDLRFGGERDWIPNVTAKALVADAAEALDKLWTSWDFDSFIADQSTGLYVDPAGIRRINHDGAYSIAGPLTLPTSHQKLPVRGQVLDDENVIREDIDIAFVRAGAKANAPLVVEILDCSTWRSDRSVLSRSENLLLEAQTLDDLHILAEQLQKHDVTGKTLREQLGVPAPSVDLALSTPAFFEGNIS